MSDHRFYEMVDNAARVGLEWCDMYQQRKKQEPCTREILKEIREEAQRRLTESAVLGFGCETNQLVDVIERDRQRAVKSILPFARVA